MTRTEERIAGLRERWDPEAELHGVLAEARKLRASGHIPSPSTLYYNAGEDADLYLHAMIEVGAVLDGPDGQPYSVCPVCDHALMDDLPSRFA